MGIRRKKRRKHRRYGLTVFLTVLLLGVLSVFVIIKVFTVDQVIVEGNELYSSGQIEEIVLNDKYAWNSLYVYLKYKLKGVGDIPFVDDMEISLDDPHTIRIHVYEKGILGSFYIDSIGQYAYFDKDGFVVETSPDVIQNVPKITGITCREVVLYEKLPLEEEYLLAGLLELTQTLNKYGILPREVHFASGEKPELGYGEIKVVVGTMDYLSQKIVRLSNILPQLEGKQGTLHLENWTPETTDIYFSK